MQGSRPGEAETDIVVHVRRVVAAAERRTTEVAEEVPAAAP